MVTTSANPFLEGNFAPVHEEVQGQNLNVIGELPAELDGMFLRNGPNPQFPPEGRYHWFDGDGMLHAVRIEGGKASYLNRFVRTSGWQKENAAGRALYRGLLEPPPGKNSGGKNPANTSVVFHDGRLLALWEGGEPYLVRMPELETVGPFDYAGDLFSPFTAHPKVDVETGEMMSFGYNPDKAPHLLYSIASEGGQLRTVPIDLPVGVMMHDFAITEDYTIFMDLPLTFRTERIAQGQPPFQFEPDINARFGILPRYGDNRSIRWFETPSCWVWHVLNAYQYGDEIVLTACKMFSPGTQFPIVGRGSRKQTTESAHLHQWRFNLASGRVKEEPIDSTPVEFPRMDDRLAGRQARYGYAAREVMQNETSFFDGLVKYDLLSGRTEIHHFGKGRFGGEGVFVPRAAAQSEDDGFLMTFVFDYSTDTSELLVVDARNVTAQPVARIVLPQRVPYGFHGNWVSAKEIASQR